MVDQREGPVGGLGEVAGFLEDEVENLVEALLLADGFEDPVDRG